MPRKSLTLKLSAVVAVLAIASSLGFMWVFAVDKTLSDATKLSVLATRTIVMNDRYIPIPWDMSESTVKEIAAALEGMVVVQITDHGGRTEAYLAREGVQPGQVTTISGTVAELVKSPSGWRVQEEAHSRFGRNPEDLVGDDMRIWRAFMGFARQVASDQGVRFSRSDGVFFIPGESFRLKNGIVELRYFRTFWNSTPGKLRNPSKFATVTIDGIHAASSGDH